MKIELMVAWRYLGKTGKERFFSLIGLPLLVVMTGFIGLIIYLIAKRKGRFISLFSIAISGIALGVMALIVVIAVMTGFDKDLRDKIVGNYSHITLASYNVMDNNKYDNIVKKISANPHVKGISPYVQGQALIKDGNRFFAIGLKGIEPDKEIQVTKIKQYVVNGNVNNLKEGGIIIGKELALYLGLSLNSNVLIYSPLGKQHNLKVAGIFNSGMYDYDLNLAFVNLKSAQEILGLPNQISAIAIKLDNLHLADKVRKDLFERLGFDYILKTWMEANQSFFAALKLEKITMFIILTLIILVASLNIVSTLIVLVVEKTKDIGILKSIGLNSKGIRRIFTYEGMLVGFFGTTLGSLGGLVLCGILKKYQFIKLPQDIYYIDKLPVAIDFWPDIVLVVASAIIIVLIATLYPAGKAARLEPVEALRYE